MRNSNIPPCSKQNFFNNTQHTGCNTPTFYTSTKQSQPNQPIKTKQPVKRNQDESHPNNRMGDIPFLFAFFLSETKFFAGPWKIKPEHFCERARKKNKKKVWGLLNKIFI